MKTYHEIMKQLPSLACSIPSQPLKPWPWLHVWRWDVASANQSHLKHREHQVSTIHCRTKKWSDTTVYHIILYILYTSYTNYTNVTYHSIITWLIVSSWHVMTLVTSKDVGPPSPLWCRSQGTASRQLKRWSCWRSGFRWWFRDGPCLWGWAIHGCWEMKMFGVTIATSDPNLKVRVLTQNWLGSRPHRSWTLEMLELCATPGSGCRQKDCASCNMECNSYTTLHKTIHHATC